MFDADSDRKGNKDEKVDQVVKQLVDSRRKIQKMLKTLTTHTVTVKGPDGKLMRHPIIDYGSMTHREFHQLSAPKPETARVYEEKMKEEVAALKLSETKWLEMNTFSKIFLMKQTGPTLHYILGEVEFKETASFIDLYVQKLAQKEQLVIFLGPDDATYYWTHVVARDFSSSDMIEANMPEEQQTRILKDFANGKFQMLFISYARRGDIIGRTTTKDPDPIWKNVRVVIIEEFGKERNFVMGPDRVKTFLQTCRVAYNSELSDVDVLTLFRQCSAYQNKAAVEVYMLEAHGAHKRNAIMEPFIPPRYSTTKIIRGTNEDEKPPRRLNALTDGNWRKQDKPPQSKWTRSFNRFS